MKLEYKFNELMTLGEFIEARELAESEEARLRKEADAWLELGNKASWGAIHALDKYTETM